MLAPLVAADAVRVLPMQQAAPGRPWLLEICPASTLKQLDLYGAYKGRSPAHAASRADLLTELGRRAGVFIEEDALRSVIIGDPGGDALDSVVAALGEGYVHA